MNTDFFRPLINRHAFPVKLKNMLGARGAQRRGQRLFYRPSSIYSAMNSALRQIHLIRPLFYCQRLAVKLKVAIASGIARLLCSCGPSAVCWGVSKIVVNSVNAVLWPWSRTHIGNEVFKAMPPALAYRYASTAVVFVGFLIGVFASRDNRAPDGEFGRIAHSVRLANVAHPLPIKAAAAFCVPIKELACGHNRKVATLTFAEPPCIAPLARACTDEADHSKTPKLLAGNIPGSLVGDGDDLRQIASRVIVGVHQKLSFWCLIRERFAVAARYFSLARTPVIIAQFGGMNK